MRRQSRRPNRTIILKAAFPPPERQSDRRGKKADTDFWTPPREASIHSPFSPAAETAPEPVFPNVPLNEKQLAAVTAPKNPSRSGRRGKRKTRVLTARAAYMISRLDIPPSAILLVTFTTKL
ncbi:hypothetical protein PO124_28540 [Bacillus licheniformis]|nr:hypothetical protein [Bacillus licheniformis]